MSKRPRDRTLEAELANEGFAVRELPKGVLNEQPKATYYKPDGTALPNLPADAYSRPRYLSRGFTLTPPEHPVTTLSARVGADDDAPKKAVARIYVCETCGHEFEAKIALFGHKRSHAKAKTRDN